VKTAAWTSLFAFLAIVLASVFAVALLNWLE